MGNLSVQQVTKNLWLAMLVQAGASVLAALLLMCGLAFPLTGGILDLLAIFAAPMTLIVAILNLVAWGATIWFLISLGNWKKVADANDVPAIKKLWLGNLLIIIGGVVSFLIPVAGWILGPLVALAGWIINLLGVLALKKSTTLHAGGVQGMNLIFIAIILSVAAGVLAFVPVLPSLLGIASWVLLVLGWKKVAEA